MGEYDELLGMDHEELFAEYTRGLPEGSSATKQAAIERALTMRSAFASERAAQAQAAAARWTKYLLFATVLLAGTSALFSVLTFIEDEPRPEAPVQVLPIGQSRTDTAAARESNEERLRDACKTGGAEILQLHVFGDPAPFGYVTCAELEGDKE